MVVNFNFNLEAWIKSVDVEANSVEAAKEKLMSMSLQDLIDADNFYAGEVSVTAVDYNITARDVVVEVYNIVYDTVTTMHDASAQQTIKLRDVEPSTDIEELIAEELCFRADAEVISFDYRIVSES